MKQNELIKRAKITAQLDMLASEIEPINPMVAFALDKISDKVELIGPKAPGYGIMQEVFEEGKKQKIRTKDVSE